MSMASRDSLFLYTLGWGWSRGTIHLLTHPVSRLRRPERLGLLSHLTLYGLSIWSFQHGGLAVARLLKWQFRAAKLGVLKEEKKESSSWKLYHFL